MIVWLDHARVGHCQALNPNPLRVPRRGFVLWRSFFMSITDVSACTYWIERNPDFNFLSGFAHRCIPRPDLCVYTIAPTRRDVQMLLLSGNLMRLVLSPEGEDIRLGLTGFLGGLAMAFCIGLELL